MLHRAAGRRGPASAAAGRAVAGRPHARRGADRARRGAGEDRRVRGARGQRPADGAAGAAGDGRRVPQARPVAPALAAAGDPGGEGRRRTAAGPRVVDRGDRAARRSAPSCAAVSTPTRRRWPGSAWPRTRCSSSGTTRPAGCCGARPATCARPSRPCCATSRRPPKCWCPRVARARRTTADRSGGIVSQQNVSSEASGAEFAGTVPAARLRGDVRGHGRRRAVLRHLRAGPGRLVDAAWWARRRPGITGRRPGGSRQLGRAQFAVRSRRLLALPRRGPPSRAARCRAGCRARCRAAATAGRCRCAAPARPPRPRAAAGSAPAWCRYRTCRGPTRRRRCRRTPRCPSASGSARARDCGAPVGRAAASGPGRTEGFCTKCGHPYSFVPKLRTGDVVHGQYEVVGCLAHGGLGWVYLAVDRAVSDRWVVLKGLLDTGDEDAHGGRDLGAALPRRDRALQHRPDLQLRRAPRPAHRLPRRLHRHGVRRRQVAQGDRQRAPHGPTGKRDPLPVEQAFAYAIEALEALGHLHSRNLLYCDFKVDNAIQTEDRLELIDMGAVRRMDDDESAIYGTVGYQAPEVAEVGPSVASDLYTVARTLAVLTFDFQGYTNVFVDTLPDPDNIEVFRRYESFYRLLVRATDPDPARRFASAQEMADQLTRRAARGRGPADGPAAARAVHPVRARTAGHGHGVVRALAGDVSRLGRTGRSRCAEGTGAPALPAGARTHVGRPGRRPRAGTAGPTAAVPPAALPAAPASLVKPLNAAAAALALPVPRVDPGDPNAGFLAGLMASAPAELITALRAAPADSVELRLRELRARLEMGDSTPPPRRWQRWRRRTRDDWRVVWYRGRGRARDRRPRDRGAVLRRDLRRLPRRARARSWRSACARRCSGQLDNAAEYYRLVWTTDPQLRERRVRPGPGAAGRGRPAGRRAHAGVRTGGVDPLHGGPGRRGAVRAAAAARAVRARNRCWTT